MNIYVNEHIKNIREFDILIPTKNETISFEVKDYSLDRINKTVKNFEGLSLNTKERLHKQICAQKRVIK